MLLIFNQDLNFLQLVLTFHPRLLVLLCKGSITPLVLALFTVVNSIFCNKKKSFIFYSLFKFLSEKLKYDNRISKNMICKNQNQKKSSNILAINAFGRATVMVTKDFLYKINMIYIYIVFVIIKSLKPVSV